MRFTFVFSARQTRSIVIIIKPARVPECVHKQPDIKPRT